MNLLVPHAGTALRNGVWRLLTRPNRSAPSGRPSPGRNGRPARRRHGDLPVALVAHPLRLLEVGHDGRLGAAVLAEDLAAVPAVVLSVGEGELAVAAVAGSGLGVVSPLAASLLRQLDLEEMNQIIQMMPFRFFLLWKGKLNICQKWLSASQGILSNYAGKPRFLTLFKDI